MLPLGSCLQPKSVNGCDPAERSLSGEKASICLLFPDELNYRSKFCSFADPGSISHRAAVVDVSQKAPFVRHCPYRAGNAGVPSWRLSHNRIPQSMSHILTMPM